MSFARRASNRIPICESKAKCCDPFTPDTHKIIFNESCTITMRERFSCLILVRRDCCRKVNPVSACDRSSVAWIVPRSIQNIITQSRCLSAVGGRHDACCEVRIGLEKTVRNKTHGADGFTSPRRTFRGIGSLPICDNCAKGTKLK